MASFIAAVQGQGRPSKLPRHLNQEESSAVGANAGVPLPWNDMECDESSLDFLSVQEGFAVGAGRGAYLQNCPEEISMEAVPTPKPSTSLALLKKEMHTGGEEETHESVEEGEKEGDEDGAESVWASYEKHEGEEEEKEVAQGGERVKASEDWSSDNSDFLSEWTGGGKIEGEEEDEEEEVGSKEAEEEEEEAGEREKATKDWSSDNSDFWPGSTDGKEREEEGEDEEVWGRATKPWCNENLPEEVD